MTEIRVAPGGTPKWTRDAATNGSNKTFTVPTGKVWEIISIAADITCTATVGNRILRASISNATPAVIYGFTPTSSIAATQVGSLYLESGFGAASTTVRRGPSDTTPNVTLCQNIARLVLPAGYSIRVWDSAAVDAAADDMIVTLNYIEYEA